MGNQRQRFKKGRKLPVVRLLTRDIDILANAIIKTIVYFLLATSITSLVPIYLNFII